MRPRKISTADPFFVDRVRALEERLFADELDPGDASRMKSHGKYSWLYRPSHHAAAGLLTQEDVALLSEKGRRLLSVGAHPAFFERLLPELGVPAENMLLADVDPGLADVCDPIPHIIFDAVGPWPDLGTFDRIIFPESLCIAISDNIKKRGIPDDLENPYANDVLEAQLLAHILTEALARLRPQGVIRANGPMSHPTVVKAMSAMLLKEGIRHAVKYERFFLTVTHSYGKACHSELDEERHADVHGSTSSP